MLTGIRVLFWGQVLERFATGICVLAVQNMATAELDIGRILSVCVSVCLFTFFFGRFLDQFEQEFNCNFMKRALKKRGPTRHATPRWPVFDATLLRSLHSPQMAPAAPPSPSA